MNIRTVIRNKARLFAKGYAQEEGIDLVRHHFAPVARSEAVRIFRCPWRNTSFSNLSMTLRKRHSSCPLKEEQSKSPVDIEMSLIGEDKILFRTSVHSPQDADHADALILWKSTSGGITFLVISLFFMTYFNHKVVRLGINPMIQPEPERRVLSQDNPKLEIASLRYKIKVVDDNLNPFKCQSIKSYYLESSKMKD
ncbi:hypothetical protein Tco_0058054 [Tanacetum coccineum]